MSIRIIDKNIGTVPTWGDDDFDENVHQNFLDLKEIIPKINTTVADIDSTVNEMNILKNQGATSATSASSSANTAILKASEASVSASQALLAKNQIQDYVIPAGASYSVEQLNTKYSAMTKAQFNALAEERKANRAGSGFDEWGKHNSNIGGYPNVNEGIITSTTSNVFGIGEITSSIGVSKTTYPIALVNGINHRIQGVSASNGYGAVVTLPTAPTIYPSTATLTAEQIASGVIKHADASNSGLIVNGKFDTDTSGWPVVTGSWSISGGSATNNGSSPASILAQSVGTQSGREYIFEFEITAYTSGGVKARVGNSRSNAIASSLGKHTIRVVSDNANATLGLETANYFNGTIDNIAVYPADAISRSDLVFLESWHEDISEKNFVYPLGNVQYLGGNSDGLTGIANGSFTGFETYSLFGNWQTSSALIGKGYVWSSLTEAQKKAFISNAENNCYLDGDKVIQVRYRVRVVQGLGDSWANVSDTVFDLYQTLNTTLVRAKGKQASITSEFGVSSTYYFTGLTGSSSVNKAGIGVFTARTYSAGSLPDADVSITYDGKCFALPIALVHRRNQGAYHPVYNPNGTSSRWYSDGSPLKWYSTLLSQITSISDCFNFASPSAVQIGKVPSGIYGAFIASVPNCVARPDGLFYDQIHEGDILDLRNSSKKVEDYNRLISREFNKLVAGTNRGKEGEWNCIYNYTGTVTEEGFYSTASQTTGTYVRVSPNIASMSGSSKYIAIINNIPYYIVRIDNNNQIYLQKIIGEKGDFRADITVGNTIDVYKIDSITRTKSNTLLHCDIIGNPTNYPASWKQSGVFGTPLVVAEDGTSLLPNGTLDTFKLSRKANATPLLCLRSTNNGTTWSSFTPTFSTTTNAITLTDEPAANLVMVYYQTHTSMAVPVANSEVLEIGNVYASQNNANSNISFSLIGKILTGAGGIGQNYSPLTKKGTYIWSPFKFDDAYRPQHDSISIDLATSPTFKTFPYLTRLNGKAYLNLVFKEMKHNGTSWGDDTKFNIVDSVSTTTDNNAQTVLIGQKTVELPYFIGADE